jgi:hypothetical protein
MSKRKATKRLTEFSFDEDFCHVALVDQAANEHGIVVMKAKQVSQTPVNKSTDQVSDEPKDDNMSIDESTPEVVIEKAQEVITKNCEKHDKAECTKCMKKDDKKEDKKEDYMKKSEEVVEEVIETVTSLEEVLKSNKELTEQIATFKAAKLEADKAVFVSKAKEQSNIVKDAEADALFVFKSLAPEAFEVVMKALETANTALEGMEVVVKSVGSSEEGANNPDMSFEDKVTMKSKEITDADSSIKPYVARTQARADIRKEAKKASFAK